MSTPTALRGQEPIERFRPTTGSFVGWAGLVVAALMIVLVLVDSRSVTSLRLSLAILLVGELVALTQLRPRVTAYDEGLLIRGTIGDTFVPYRSITQVVMGQTLSVFVGAKRYVCIGIGRSLGADMRARARAQQHGSVAATRSYSFAGKPEGESNQYATKYHDFVLDRILDLVKGARALPREDPPEPVRHSWAVLELAVLGVTALALVVTLLL